MESGRCVQGSWCRCAKAHILCGLHECEQMGPRDISAQAPCLLHITKATNCPHALPMCLMVSDPFSEVMLGQYVLSFPQCKGTVGEADNVSFLSGDIPT